MAYMTESNNENLFKRLDELETQYFKQKYLNAEKKSSVFDNLTPSLLLFFSAVSMFYESLFNITIILSKKTPIPQKAFQMWFKLKHLYHDSKYGALYYYDSYMCDTNKSLIHEKSKEFGNKICSMSNIMRDLLLSENKEFIESKISEFSELNNKATSHQESDIELNVSNNNLMYGGD